MLENSAPTFCKSQRIKLQINAKRIISYSFCVNTAEQFITTHLQPLETLEIFLVQLWQQSGVSWYLEKIKVRFNVTVRYCGLVLDIWESSQISTSNDWAIVKHRVM